MDLVDYSNDPYRGFEKRIARFSISMNMVKEQPKNLIKMFSQMLIVEATSHYYDHTIEYIAMSTIFPIVKEGLMPTHITTT